MLAIALARPALPPPPVERAARWHEHNPLEGAYALVLARVVGVPAVPDLHRRAPGRYGRQPERPALTVDVTGSKWEWTFAYPGLRHHASAAARSGASRWWSPRRAGSLQPHLGRRDPLVLDPRASTSSATLIPGATEVATLDFPRTGCSAGNAPSSAGSATPT